jgi:hypothetical protein
MTLFFYVFQASLATATEVPEVLWTKDRSTTLSAGHKELGLFGPLRFGLENDWEIRVQPVLIFLSPGVQAKKTISEKDKHSFGVDMGLTYPAPLLNLLAREGTGGVLAPDIAIPKSPKLMSTARYTFEISKAHYLSLWQRVDLAPLAGSYDEESVLKSGQFPFTSIDAPLAYPRTAILRESIAIQTGVVLDGDIHKRWEYEVKTAMWVLPNLSENNWAFESHGIIRFLIKPDRALQTGMIYSLAEYPYGKQWHILPTIDARWYW